MRELDGTYTQVNPMIKQMMAAPTESLGLWLCLVEGWR
jgi:hypothetical protein